jgi:predicted negative regulator of RcsB-dependent stress response
VDYETEEQQVEALKNWWKENSRSVVAGVVIGGSVIGGWQLWKGRVESQAVAASDGFAQTLEAVISGDAPTALSLADTLADDHDNTLYAAYAQLAAARAEVEADNLEGAATRLAWVADQAEQADVKLIAAIRLARVQGAIGNVEEGLKRLPDTYPEAFTGLVEEARGDLLLLSGDAGAARAAYEQARDSGQAVDATALDMKIDDLPAISSAS